MHLETRKDWDGSEAYLIAMVSDAKKTKIGLFSHDYFVTILAGCVEVAPISPL
jgi:hypothetical protein